MDRNSSSKQKTLCEKLIIAIRSTASFRTFLFSYSQQHHNGAAIASTSPSANVCLMTDRTAQVCKQPVVPLHFDTATKKKDPNAYRKSKVPANKAQEKVTFLPIHGNENKPPTMAEGPHAKSAAAERMDRMFSDYINQTRHRFHSMSSTVETSSFKGRVGAKERRLK